MAGHNTHRVHIHYIKFILIFSVQNEYNVCNNSNDRFVTINRDTHQSETEYVKE
jgi:hypothetical protein